MTLSRIMHYRHRWLTNDQFDNRYLTDDLRTIDLIRSRQDKETILPLNQRERNQYIPLKSVTLIKVERVKLAKSVFFLGLTTFKICIHMMADYSLYWMLSIIRYHGRIETKVFGVMFIYLNRYSPHIHARQNFIFARNLFLYRTSK